MRKFSILFFVFGLVFLINNSAFSKEDAAGKEVLAKVGKYTLTLKEFNEQVKSLPPQLQMAIAKNPQLKEQLLKRWVDLTLMALEARKEGYQNRPDVKRRIEEVINALLAQEYIRKNISDPANVSDKEIKDYYEKHKSQFMQPEQVKASHILIRVPSGADNKKWNEAKKKAQDIRKQIMAGEDFATLAKKYSQDPGSKSRGGDLGYFKKGQMVPDFEKAAFSLKKGEVSQPVKTTFGYHIIKVYDKKPAKQKSLKDAKQEIRQMLLRKKQFKLRDEIIAKLKKKYKVEVHKDLLKKAEVKGNVHTSKK